MDFTIIVLSKELNRRRSEREKKRGSREARYSHRNPRLEEIDSSAPHGDGFDRLRNDDATATARATRQRR
jgi:hypothetical protein